MLVAAVIQLQAQADGRIQGGTSRAVHGFWFRQWQQTAPAIADALHQAPAVQPYTLTPIMGLPRPRRGQTHIAAGETGWFRIATLHPDISHPFLETWLTRLPAHIELAGIPWAVQTIALTPAQRPWAGQADYAQLHQQHHAAAPVDNWHIHFHTPTAFRSGDNDQLPFPLPNSLVNSWLRRWQAFSPIPIPNQLCARIRQRLHISAYTLKTVPIRHGRRLEIGCVGDLTLSGRQLSPTEQNTISLLADYAFYCGSGRHTTQGMGMTRIKERDRQ